MFNSYGWIQLGMNRKHLNPLDKDAEIKSNKGTAAIIGLKFKL